MGLTIFKGIFLDNPHIQTECGQYLKIFFETFSISQNIVMDLNNVMLEVHLQGIDVFTITPK